jgi:hypothetical protein
LRLPPTRERVFEFCSTHCVIGCMGNFVLRVFRHSKIQELKSKTSFCFAIRGRNGEGGAEDPFLMGAYAAAYTTGFQYQGGDPSTTKYLTAILTLKHYVANSLDNTVVNRTTMVDGQTYAKGDMPNRHTMDVTISNSQLQEYLAAFRAAAKAGAKGMMCSCERGSPRLHGMAAESLVQTSQLVTWDISYG